VVSRPKEVEERRRPGERTGYEAFNGIVEGEDFENKNRDGGLSGGGAEKMVSEHSARTRTRTPSNGRKLSDDTAGRGQRSRKEQAQAGGGTEKGR